MIVSLSNLGRQWYAATSSTCNIVSIAGNRSLTSSCWRLVGHHSGSKAALLACFSPMRNSAPRNFLSSEMVISGHLSATCDFPIGVFVYLTILSKNECRKEKMQHPYQRHAGKKANSLTKRCWRLLCSHCLLELLVRSNSHSRSLNAAWDSYQLLWYSAAKMGVFNLITIVITHSNIIAGPLPSCGLILCCFQPAYDLHPTRTSSHEASIKRYEKEQTCCYRCFNLAG